MDLAADHRGGRCGRRRPLVSRGRHGQHRRCLYRRPCRRHRAAGRGRRHRAARDRQPARQGGRRSAGDRSARLRRGARPGAGQPQRGRGAAGQRADQPGMGARGVPGEARGCAGGAGGGACRPPQGRGRCAAAAWPAEAGDDPAGGRHRDRGAEHRRGPGGSGTGGGAAGAAGAAVHRRGGGAGAPARGAGDAGPRAVGAGDAQPVLDQGDRAAGWLDHQAQCRAGQLCAGRPVDPVDRHAGHLGHRQLQGIAAGPDAAGAACGHRHRRLSAPEADRPRGQHPAWFRVPVHGVSGRERHRQLREDRAACAGEDRHRPWPGPRPAAAAWRVGGTDGAAHWRRSWRSWTPRSST